MLDGQKELKTEAANFQEIGAQLLELSKEDSGKSRVEFVIGFVKDVKDDLKEAKEDSLSDTQ